MIWGRIQRMSPLKSRYWGIWRKSGQKGDAYRARWERVARSWFAMTARASHAPHMRTVFYSPAHEQLAFGSGTMPIEIEKSPRGEGWHYLMVNCYDYLPPLHPPSGDGANLESDLLPFFASHSHCESSPFIRWCEKTKRRHLWHKRQERGTKNGENGKSPSHQPQVGKNCAEIFLVI